MQIANRGLGRFFANMPRLSEEVANDLTHAVGFALSIAASVSHYFAVMQFIVPTPT